MTALAEMEEVAVRRLLAVINEVAVMSWKLDVTEGVRRKRRLI